MPVEHCVQHKAKCDRIACGYRRIQRAPKRGEPIMKASIQITAALAAATVAARREIRGITCDTVAVVSAAPTAAFTSAAW